MELQQQTQSTDPSLKKFRHKRELTYFYIGFVISALVWAALVVGTIGMGLVFIGLFVLLFAILNGLFLAHVRGYGIAVTEHQYPDIFARAKESAEKLGLEKVPEIYILNMNGMYNAFATQFFSRDFVILSADLVRVIQDDPDRLNFIVTHELGHIKFNHVHWQGFLFPMAIIPLLGSAYSRSREYTCDTVATEFGVNKNLDAAYRSLVTLSVADNERATTTDLDAYHEQGNQVRGFFSTVAELNSTHPYTFNRITYLRNFFSGSNLSFPKRSILGTLFALLFSRSMIFFLYIALVVVAIAMDESESGTMFDNYGTPTTFDASDYEGFDDYGYGYDESLGYGPDKDGWDDSYYDLTVLEDVDITSEVVGGNIVGSEKTIKIKVQNNSSEEIPLSSIDIPMSLTESLDQLSLSWPHYDVYEYYDYETRVLYEVYEFDLDSLQEGESELVISGVLNTEKDVSDPMSFCFFDGYYDECLPVELK